MAQILLTGFEPFANESINPSKELVRSAAFHGVESHLVLPVSFQRAFPKIKQSLDSKEFSDILMLGQAGGRTQVCLERVALNWVETAVADEDGQLEKGRVIEPGASPAWISPYPIREWCDAGRLQNLPMEVSNTAGTFVCNDLSFKVAQWSLGKNVRWLFVHLPYLPEQVIQKPNGVPSMDLISMKKCIQFIIDKIHTL
jgi:pyroglutamyl-peptidase